MKRIQISLFVLIIIVLFSGLVNAKGMPKEDICKVIVYSNGDFKRDLAQYTKIPRTSGISQPCLDFANLSSTITSACGGGDGQAQIYQIRWIMTKTQDLAAHCHYKCLGDANSGCEDRCKRKPAQIPSNIGIIQCPQGK